eukprot:4268109-Pyramimonas_sp.AAC.1
MLNFRTCALGKSGRGGAEGCRRRACSKGSNEQQPGISTSKTYLHQTSEATSDLTLWNPWGRR